MHPLAGLQLSSVQRFSSLQLGAPTPAQVPFAHPSTNVHALPSSHPTEFALPTQSPLSLSQLSSVHKLPSLQTFGLPTHAPPAHESLTVHGLPSLQSPPSLPTGLLQVPVVVSQVPATWQTSLAVQVFALPPTQVPFEHVSVCVHAFPSLQAPPLLPIGLLQVPVAVSQVPALWQTSLAVQVFALPPTQAPFEHVSVCVHALPSLHVPPLLPIGLLQVPVAVSQVPALWHASLAVQVFALPPTQVPFEHVSVCVQAFPSLHVPPLLPIGLLHVPVAVSQVPALWQASLAVQVFALPPTQVPFAHVSVCVQAFPSLQVAPLFPAGLLQVPVLVSQVPAMWHASLAVQVFALPPTQVPFEHVSVCVHAFPSLQAPPLLPIGLLQVPVDVSQVPALWQTSLAVQVLAFPPTQAPFAHVSVWVHALPSLHVPPLLPIGLLQVPVAVSQVPALWQASLAVQVFALPPTQAPFAHVSVCVHAFPSLHPPPLLPIGLLHVPVDVSQVPAVWQTSLAVQTLLLPPTQLPFEHVSVCVHALPSLHVPPLLPIGLLQVPVAVSQVPALWQTSLAVQVFALPPTQAPFAHVSVCVQAFPSLHTPPLLPIGLLQVPVTVSQVPALWQTSLAVQTLLLPPTQLPFEHVSVCVHAFPSLQAPPLLPIGLLQVPVLVSQVPALWQTSLAVQVFALPQTQAPLEHVSVCVQAFPSLHVPPLLPIGLLQVPVDVSQVPALWQTSLAVQVFALPPTQVPFEHVSVCVHAFPSLHVPPLFPIGLLQVPVAVSQVPPLWQTSLAVQVFALLPTQVPFEHVSVCVHALPSLHAPPLLPIGLLQVPVLVSQVPALWQTSLAVQVFALPPTQAPFEHVSVCVHAFPSLQAPPLLPIGLLQVPVVVSQVPALWQASLAVQVFALPPTQVPFEHVSVCVQAFPSLHVAPLFPAGLLQVPVLVSQVPATWQASLAVHTLLLLPTHVPLTHVSVCVHALPSLHVVSTAHSDEQQSPSVVLPSSQPSVPDFTPSPHVCGRFRIAFLILISPYPKFASGAPLCEAVVVSAFFTYAGFSPGHASSSNVAAPAAIGVAMEVPCIAS